MARNINECKGKRYGRMLCAFHDPGTGKCMISSRDVYNLLPEHNRDGSVVYNGNPNDPWGIASWTNLIWESLSSHEHGLSYTPEYEGRQIRRREDIHPLYSRIDRTIPLIGSNEDGVRTEFDEDQVGEVFGGDHLSLVSRGWSDEKFLKIRRVEYCQWAIYGTVNKNVDLVIPRCVKDYSADILGWERLATLDGGRRKKSFYIHAATTDEIKNFCVNKFGVTTLAMRVAKSMIKIKEGHYIDLRDLLRNNGLSEEKVANIMMGVSTRNPKTLYAGRMNLQKLHLYYHAIGNMRLPEYERDRLRSNLINYIINYPPNKEFDIEDTKRKRTNQRVWFNLMVIKRAYNEGRIPYVNGKESPYHKYFTVAEIPDWIKKQMDTLQTYRRRFRLFGKEYRDDDSCPKQVRDMVSDCIMWGLDEPQQLFPIMERVEDILEINKNSRREVVQYKFFKDVIKVGKNWSPSELRTAWFYFKKAFDRNRHSIFWAFIENMVEANQDQADERIKEPNSKASATRTFAINLLNGRVSRESFDVQSSPINEGWFQAFARHAKCGLSHSDVYEVDWQLLARIGGLKLDKIRDDATEEEKEDLREYLLVTEPDEKIMATSIDEEDLEDLTIKDINEEEI